MSALSENSAPLQEFSYSFLFKKILWENWQLKNEWIAMSLREHCTFSNIFFSCTLDSYDNYSNFSLLFNF